MSNSQERMSSKALAILGIGAAALAVSLHVSADSIRNSMEAPGRTEAELSTMDFHSELADIGAGALGTIAITELVMAASRVRRDLNQQ